MSWPQFHEHFLAIGIWKPQDWNNILRYILEHVNILLDGDLIDFPFKYFAVFSEKW